MQTNVYDVFQVPFYYAHIEHYADECIRPVFVMQYYGRNVLTAGSKQLGRSYDIVDCYILI